jgi:hypothetical protein
MKVKAIGTSGRDLSITSLNNQYHNIEEEFQLKIGDIYITYGIGMMLETIYYLTFDKWENVPFWTPAELFEIVDFRLPQEWYFVFYGYAEKRMNVVNALWGYKEMATNRDHYIQLIEREPDAMAIFERRRQEIDHFHIDQEK